MRYASIARSLATVLLLLLVAAGRCVRSAPANTFQPTDVSTERLSARYAHAAAAWSGVVCVFGGYTDEMAHETANTTFIYFAVSSIWTEVTASILATPDPIVNPPPRGFHTFVAVANGTHKVGMIFGGAGPLPRTPHTHGLTVFDDVWSFDFATFRWTFIEPVSTVVPQARFGHTCIEYDVNSEQIPETVATMFCYGGRSANGTIFGDLWAFNIQSREWSVLYDPDVMLYTPDPVHRRSWPRGHRIVTWSSPELAAHPNDDTNATVPSPRYFHSSFSLSLQPSKLYITGGRTQDGFCRVRRVSQNGECFDTWAFDLRERTWTRIQSPGGGSLYLPVSSVGMHAVGRTQDAVLEGYSEYSIMDVIVVFAPGNGTVGTASLYPSMGTWVVHSQHLTPYRKLRRFDAVVAVSFAEKHDIDNHIVSIAGETVTGTWLALNDTWAIAEQESLFVWTNVAPPIIAPPFFDTAGVLLRNYQGDSLFFVFGGQSISSPISGEMWRFNVSSSLWTRTASQNPNDLFRNLSPTVMIGQSIVPWGTESRAFVLYGGAIPPQGKIFTQAWSFNLTGTVEHVWTEMNTTVTPMTTLQPPGRWRHVAAACGPYCMLVFGGISTLNDDPVLLNDTWLLVAANDDGEAGALERATWYPTALNSTHTPASRSQTASVYDKSTACLYIFGGLGYDDIIYNDLWRLCNATIDGGGMWRYFVPDSASPSLVPTPRFGALLTLVDQKLILYGGSIPPSSLANVTLDPSQQYPIISTNELFSFHLVDSTWQHLNASSQATIDQGDVAPLQGITGALSYATTNGTTFSIFGGVAMEDNSDEVPGSLGTLRVGCSPGSATSQFGLLDCILCPAGFYAESAGMTACKECDGETNTTKIGATSPDDCNVCRDDACHHHGACTLSESKKPICTCELMYRISTTCDAPIVGGLIAATSIVLVVLLIVVVLVQRSRKLSKNLDVEHMMTSSLQNRLHTERGETRTLKTRLGVIEAMTISFEDLNLNLNRSSTIGEGGAAEVYRGTYGGDPVAVKILHKQHRGQNDLVGFEQDAQTLRALAHPNIIKLIGVGVYEAPEHPDEVFPFLVMEYMHRGSLDRLLWNTNNDGSPIAWTTRISYALDAARGIAHLHSKDFIHGDIKAGNLLVGKDDRVRVSDMGTAKKTVLRQLDRVNEPDREWNTSGEWEEGRARSGSEAPMHVQPSTATTARSVSVPMHSNGVAQVDEDEDEDDENSDAAARSGERRPLLSPSRNVSSTLRNVPLMDVVSESTRVAVDELPSPSLSSSMSSSTTFQSRPTTMSCMAKLDVGSIGSPTRYAETDTAFSPAWRAPEAYVRNAQLTKAVDVYAFGVTLSEIITCRAPFHELTTPDGPPPVYDRLVKQGQRPSLPDNTLATHNVPKALVELTRACWSTRPGARPTMNEVVRRLTAIQREQLRKKNKKNKK